METLDETARRPAETDRCQPHGLPMPCPDCRQLGDSFVAQVRGNWDRCLGILDLARGIAEGYPLCCVVAFWADGPLPSGLLRGRIVEHHGPRDWSVYVPCSACRTGEGDIDLQTEGGATQGPDPGPTQEVMDA